VIQRVFTSLLLLAIGITLLIQGQFFLLLFLTCAALMIVYEFFKMAKIPTHSLSACLTYIGILLIYISSFSPHFLALWKSLPLKIMVLTAIGLFHGELLLKKMLFPEKALWIGLRMILFSASTLIFVYLMRIGTNGLFNVLFCCVIIWIGDSSAMIIGNTIGRHPLTSLSPNKTVEGVFGHVIGSTAASVLYVMIYGNLTGQVLNTGYYMILGMVISAIAQLGDLHESFIKRCFGVKDSSALLPGHGGFYDRADSTLFVMPLMFYYFNG